MSKEILAKLIRLRKTASLTLMVIGGISVLALAVFLISRLFRPPSDKGFFAALLPQVSQKESLTVRVDPSNIRSSDTFHLSWEHTAAAVGSYRLTVECPAGVSIRQPNRSDEFCNASRDVVSDAFLLLSGENRTADSKQIKLSIIFEESGSKANSPLSGFATLTIGASGARSISSGATPPPPAAASITPPSPRVAATPSTVPTPAAPNLPNLPDLSVKIIGTGTTTPDAKEFFQASSISRSQTAAVLFEVSNLGRAPAPAWSFDAWLPLDNAEFHSQPQPPIPAGGSVRLILGFSGLYSPGGEYKVTIILDPSNSIFESAKDNNRAAVILPVSG